jgi:hypothetical protein
LAAKEDLAEKEGMGQDLRHLLVVGKEGMGQDLRHLLVTAKKETEETEETEDLVVENLVEENQYHPHPHNLHM